MFDNISAQTKNAVVYTFAAIGATLVAVATCFGIYKGGRALHTNVTIPMADRLSNWWSKKVEPSSTDSSANSSANSSGDESEEEQKKEQKEEQEEEKDPQVFGTTSSSEPPLEGVPPTGNVG